MCKFCFIIFQKFHEINYGYITLIIKSKKTQITNGMLITRVFPKCRTSVFNIKVFGSTFEKSQLFLDKEIQYFLMSVEFYCCPYSTFFIQHFQNTFRMFFLLISVIYVSVSFSECYTCILFLKQTCIPLYFFRFLKLKIKVQMLRKRK